jgi:hypothetical protein
MLLITYNSKGVVQEYIDGSETTLSKDFAKRQLALAKLREVCRVVDDLRLL